MRPDCAWFRDSMATYILDTIDSQKEKARVEELNNKNPMDNFLPTVDFKMNINILEVATSYDLDSACLYLYKIVSPTKPPKDLINQSLRLSFDQFYIPKGGFYFVYSSSSDYYINRATVGDNRQDAQRSELGLKGNSMIIEYYEPKEQAQITQMHLKSIDVFF